MFTKQKLLKAVRAEGFKGEETLEAVKAWIEAEGYELPSGLDLDKCWATKAALNVETSADPDEAIAPKSKPANTVNKAAAVDADIQKGAPSVITGNKGWADTAARKRYNQRADLPIGHPKKARWVDAEQAEKAAAYMRVAISEVNGKDGDYAQKATDLEIIGGRKTLISSQFESGGFSVPEDFEPTLIDNLEEFGAARQWIGAKPMMRDTLPIPRKQTRPTVYVPGEGNSITESTPTGDQVQLVAKEYASLVTASGQYMNDSALNVADELSKDFTQALAETEDNQIFLGDGTQGSPYWGVLGVFGAFRKLVIDAGGTWATNAGNAAGLTIAGASNNAASHAEIVKPNLLAVMAKTLAKHDAGAVWVMNKTVYYSVCVDLATSLSGNTAANMLDSLGRPTLFGKPVIFAEAMPRYAGATDVVTTMPIIYGNGSAAGHIRDVKGGLSIASSEHVGFTSNKMTFRALHRKALLVSDVGNYSATVDSRVSGPVSALLMAAS